MSTFIPSIWVLFDRETGEALSMYADYLTAQADLYFIKMDGCPEYERLILAEFDQYGRLRGLEETRMLTGMDEDTGLNPAAA